MHDRTASLEQESRPFGRTGHQRLFVSVKNENHGCSFLLPSERRPRKGLSDEPRQAFLDCSSRPCWKGLLRPEHRPYPCGTFNPERQLHRIEEAFGGALTFPTELSLIPACGIKSEGWTLQGLQRRTPFGLAASPRILSGGS
jgi:hypothetical protein